MCNFCFQGVWRYFRAILARFTFSVFLSLYINYIIYRERNTEKLNLARIALKRLQTPWKQKLYTQQEKVSRFYYFFPLFWTIPKDRCISHTNSYNNAITQCNVDGNQRAWATCASTAIARQVPSRYITDKYVELITPIQANMTEHINSYTMFHNITPRVFLCCITEVRGAQFCHRENLARLSCRELISAFFKKSQ